MKISRDKKKQKKIILFQIKIFFFSVFLSIRKAFSVQNVDRLDFFSQRAGMHPPPCCRRVGLGKLKITGETSTVTSMSISLVTPPVSPPDPWRGWEVPRERGGTSSPWVSPSLQDRCLSAREWRKKAQRYLVTSVMSSRWFSARHNQRRSARLRGERGSKRRC